MPSPFGKGRDSHRVYALDVSLLQHAKKLTTARRQRRIIMVRFSKSCAPRLSSIRLQNLDGPSEKSAAAATSLAVCKENWLAPGGNGPLVCPDVEATPLRSPARHPIRFDVRDRRATI